MAARRLLALMLVLLVISTVAAALTAPGPDREDPTTRATGAARSGSDEGGRLIESTLDTSGRRREAIEAQPGDQLALIVRSRVPGEIEIPAFGALEYATPRAPARFDLLLERAGRYPVRAVGSNRAIATIVVRLQGGDGRRRDANARGA